MRKIQNSKHYGNETIMKDLWLLHYEPFSIHLNIYVQTSNNCY